MKIVIYYEQIGYGGVDTQLAHLVNSWPSNDDHFTIVSNPDNEGLVFLKQLLCNPEVSIRTLDGVFERTVDGASILVRVLAYLKIQLRFVRAFKKLLKEISPDIMLSNNGGYPGGITNWWAAIIGKQRERMRNSTFLLVHHAPTSKMSYLFAVYAGLLVRWVQYLGVPSITVSQASKSMLEAYTPLKKLHVIYNGVELKECISDPYDFKSEWSITEEKFLIGIIGPLDPHKGHATMLEVFRHSSYLQKKALLVIVGTGKEQLVAELKNRVCSYGLEAAIIFTGFLPGDSQRIIAGLDLLVMPTIDFEGFGYSFVEAMSVGIPVIASHVGAIPEIIENDVSGFLLEPNNVQGWCSRLEHLMDNEDERKRIGIGGQKKIEDEFSAKKMSQSYFEYFYK